LEGALKYIVRKFPTMDTRGGGASLHPVSSIKQDVLKSLSLYYYTFVDLLDLKVAVK
jgi:NCK-associated protein 1